MTLTLINNSLSVVVIERRTPLVVRPLYGAGAPGKDGASLVPMSFRGSMVTGIGVQPFVFTSPGSIALVRAAVGTAPTGADLRFDILKNGVSILSSPLSIPAGSKLSSPVVPVSGSVLAGDVVTVDVLQIGSVQPGANATLVLEVVST
jgi:hypothetical protein